MNGVISSIVTIDIEKFIKMSEKELHMQPEKDVYEAAEYLNRLKENFYSDEILKEDTYNAFLFLRMLK